MAIYEFGMTKEGPAHEQGQLFDEPVLRTVRGSAEELSVLMDTVASRQRREQALQAYWRERRARERALWIELRHH